MSAAACGRAASRSTGRAAQRSAPEGRCVVGALSPGDGMEANARTAAAIAGTDIFPLRERLRFRDRFGLALLELRSRSAPFRELEKGPWALFIAIAVHWQCNEEAWPSQDTLARFSGWSTRARFVTKLARSTAAGSFGCAGSDAPTGPTGSLCPRPCDALGTRRVCRTLPAGAVEVAQPGGAAGAVRPPTSSGSGCRCGAGSPFHGTQRSENRIEPSSSDRPVASHERWPEAEPRRTEITQEEKDIARRALADRMARKHPTRPVLLVRPRRACDRRRLLGGTRRQRRGQGPGTS